MIRTYIGLGDQPGGVILSAHLGEPEQELRHIAEWMKAAGHDRCCTVTDDGSLVAVTIVAPPKRSADR